MGPVDPHAPPISVAPVSLSYAGPAARHGIILETDRNGVRILLPGPTLRHVAGVGIGLPLLCAAVILFKLGHAAVPGSVLTIACLIPIQILWVTLFKRMRKPRSFEVTEAVFIVDNMISDTDSGGILARVVLPRSNVCDVKFVNHSRYLVIHCHGREMIELRPVRDPAALRWIAEVLREALGFEPSKKAPGDPP